MTLRRVPVGEVGELVVFGPNLARGYWGRPEAEARQFVWLIASADGGGYTPCPCLRGGSAEPGCCGGMPRPAEQAGAWLQEQPCHYYRCCCHRNPAGGRNRGA